MTQLFQLFFSIAIWRRGPQDVPASPTLLWSVALVYSIINAAQVKILGWDLRSALLLVAIDLAMLSLWVWGLLAFFNLRPRFTQTMTALLGVGLLISSMDLIIAIVRATLGSEGQSSQSWLILRLMIVLLVLGRILQQALERSLFLCIAITLVIAITTDLLVQGLIPGM